VKYRFFAAQSNPEVSAYVAQHERDEALLGAVRHARQVAACLLALVLGRLPAARRPVDTVTVALPLREPVRAGVDGRRLGGRCQRRICVQPIAERYQATNSRARQSGGSKRSRIICRLQS